MIRQCEALLAVTLMAGALHADNGYDAWLRYARLEPARQAQYAALPATIVVLGKSQVTLSAAAELARGYKRMLARIPRTTTSLPQESAVILGSRDEILRLLPQISLPSELHDDGFFLMTSATRGFNDTIVTGASERGLLYGTFALLSKIARGEQVANLHDIQQPAANLRWVDQWDNLDGSIEKGFAGRSIFFQDGSVRADLARVRDYARLLASVGLNGCNINNVNANPKILAREFIPQLARIADTLRPWGVKLSISVDFSSPKALGELDSFDPLDPRVQSWWRERATELYAAVPDLAGFTIKADSEGRSGPAAYGRTPADAANMIARALKPHGGILFYRAFVYNHHLDWNDPKADRARAAYDIFHPLDGRFEDNVVIQIKYGPIDFQAREPVSPLFAGLHNTNQAMELQVTQEYTGQQRHLVYLLPMWKQVLDFDLHADGTTLVKDLVSGKTFHRPLGGSVAVVNVGTDVNWLHDPLAMANLYAYGRIAWNPDLQPETVALEWIELTFGSDRKVVETISRMLLQSWPAYENYTGPLGLQTLTDIKGSHYGPNVEASEGNGWGQWHRADKKGVGMDRTVATGTGFTGQYPKPVMEQYESLETTPDELLLFFHHVPYTHELHSGKTVIQSIYDKHYEGAAVAAGFVQSWESLNGLIDDERFALTDSLLQYQAGHAMVWRDAVTNYFLKKSGIPDADGRVGHYPGRVEAEGMQLRGYRTVAVDPPEDASGGRAVECEGESCTAEFVFNGKPGWYELDVQYFDQNNGESQFRALVNHQQVDAWVANDHLPGKVLNGDNSVRRRIPAFRLRTGDRISIEGRPNGQERAAFDYVELIPSATIAPAAGAERR